MSKPPLATPLNQPRPNGRPLITLAIRHYNNAPFVAAALEAAFAQTYCPLEILFIDDCSTDRGVEIAQSMIEGYAGPHRVVLARNVRNLGVGGQTMRVRDLAKGEIIVFADADDISLPQRCEQIYEAFRDGGPELLCVLNHFDSINANGNVIDAGVAQFGRNPEQAENWTPEMIARGLVGTVGAIQALRRHVLEIGVPLYHLPRGDDLVCGFRCVVLGRLKTVPQVLVHRRVHQNNVSGPVRANWTLAEFRHWFHRCMRETILIPCSMRRDLTRFVREGLISEDRAAPIDRALALNTRRIKIVRVAGRLSTARAWMSVCDLQAMGVSIRDGLRMILPATAPRLEVMRLRRQAKQRTK